MQIMAGLIVVVLIILLTVYSLRRLWVVWAEILNFDGVSISTEEDYLSHYICTFVD